jgi:integrase
MAGKRRFGRVRQLPSGRWQARYLGPDGAERPAPNTFARKTDAERWLVAVEADMRRGGWVDPSAQNLTVGMWGERWLLAARGHLKIKTLAGYRSLFDTKIRPTFDELNLAALKPMMVSEWVAELHGGGLSPSRVRQSYRLLSQIMNSAVENELIAASPCRGVKLPRMPLTEPHILSRADADAIIANARPPHDLLIALLAYGGLRIGEAFALRRRCIDLERGTVTVEENLVEIAGHLSFDTPKTHQRRIVALPPSLIERLRVHLADGVEIGPASLLFVAQRTGGPIHYQRWRASWFNPAVAAAGLEDVTPHDLRASHATWVAETHGVMAAAQRLGHAHASVTTRHYARTTPGRDAEVAAAFDAERATTVTRGPRAIGHATGTRATKRASRQPKHAI